MLGFLAMLVFLVLFFAFLASIKNMLLRRMVFGLFGAVFVGGPLHIVLMCSPIFVVILTFGLWDPGESVFSFSRLFYATNEHFISPAARVIYAVVFCWFFRETPADE